MAKRDVKAHFLAEIAKLWPAARGSLSYVRKPCIRPDCPACARGDKHPSWIFSFYEKGKQRCLYVPQKLVATLRQAIANGRHGEAFRRRGARSCRRAGSAAKSSSGKWTARGSRHSGPPCAVTAPRSNAGTTPSTRATAARTSSAGRESRSRRREPTGYSSWPTPMGCP